MRKHRAAVVAAFLLGASLTARPAHAQVLPPVTARPGIQELTETHAEELAKALELRVYGTMTGNLHPEVQATITHWAAAVRDWEREPDAGAAPRLAEGVLFDCLGRMTGVRTLPLSIEENRPFFLDLADARPGRAVKAFDEALKLDPTMVEARFRADRIRASSDPDAARDLEQLAQDGSMPLLAYLAAGRAAPRWRKGR
ncbi:MAG: hypothetical protein R2752_16910 [Vicinamibacterales bacterium]